MAKYSTFTLKGEDTESINNFVPSVLNPRAIRRSADPNLSQLSTSSRFSLSLRKKPGQVLRDILNTQVNIHPMRSNIATDVSASAGPRVSKPQDKGIARQITTTAPLDSPHLSLCSRRTDNEHGQTEELVRKTENKLTDENVEILSISSCTTQLYNPYGHTTSFPLDTDTRTSQESQQYSVEVSKMDDQVILSCKFNEVFSKSNKTKRSSTPEDVAIKRKRTESAEDSLVVVLSSTAIEEYSRIIVEPPNFKLVKRDSKNNKINCMKSQTDKFHQTKITPFLNTSKTNCITSCAPSEDDDCVFVCYGDGTQSTTLEHLTKSNGLPQSTNVVFPKQIKPNLKPSNPKPCAEKQLDKKMPQTNGPRRKEIPTYKIIAGTQFAVDAFCYGNIPNVKTYFLTHFHSDHYGGLRKSFNKILYCTKITADLCTWRLGVNSKYIKIINVNETYSIDGVKVTALDANHCPGSIMLVFSLSSGKNILHCGDFRATPAMESHPVFWNLDIHTVYLDTTYCHPRYNFPTQWQSIQMALDILQRKKEELKKKNIPFARVLIACGTYTIGKENFFLGLSQREGCSVWARPEKSTLLHKVLGRRFDQQPPQRCQIHVLDVRELTHYDLKEHLDGMQGAFSEVVAFRPSGWENSTRPPAQINNVTIHGIPYSEHSSFPEMVRFVKFLRPKLVVPTVPLRDGGKTVQKYFPCPLASKEDVSQKRISDFFNITKRTLAPDVT